MLKLTNVEIIIKKKIYSYFEKKPNTVKLILYNKKKKKTLGKQLCKFYFIVLHISNNIFTNSFLNYN